LSGSPICCCTAPSRQLCRKENTKMALPGFSAELVLARVYGPHRFSGLMHSKSSLERVTPQGPKPLPCCTGNCFSNCATEAQKHGDKVGVTAECEAICHCRYCDYGPWGGPTGPNSTDCMLCKAGCAFFEAGCRASPFCSAACDIASFFGVSNCGCDCSSSCS
jgi:hypothetical protein